MAHPRLHSGSLDEAQRNPGPSGSQHEDSIAEFYPCVRSKLLCFIQVTRLFSQTCDSPQRRGDAEVHRYS